MPPISPEELKPPIPPEAVVQIPPPPSLKSALASSSSLPRPWSSTIELAAIAALAFIAKPSPPPSSTAPSAAPSTASSLPAITEPAAGTTPPDSPLPANLTISLTAVERSLGSPHIVPVIVPTRCRDSPPLSGFISPPP
ncbi:hypothetical protein K438DRAFT_2024964 [Mycena galopus ATCC 62051]|nr:hypothetical protein K438DRAFT_2024964 [Mycena galopus ATCC 62051]